MPDTALHPLRRALSQFWTAVPWMLEAAIVLEVVLGKYFEAAIIACLLVFNAALGFFQEGRAQATLAALKVRLALNASVKRDNAWKTVPATELVVGDVVKLSLGAVVAADVRLTDGSVLLDQSMLTGESVPIEAGAGFDTYAGALVRRGEAVAEVTATGARTKFGRTAELVRTAHVVEYPAEGRSACRSESRALQWRHYHHAGGLCHALLKMPVARDRSAGADGRSRIDPGGAAGHVHARRRDWSAGTGASWTFCPRSLSAVDEAASIDVLCADKTGTLTRNELTVTAVAPDAGLRRSPRAGLAALASSDGGQDPVDAAIRAAAVRQAASDLPKLINSCRSIRPRKCPRRRCDADGGTVRVVKGAFAASPAWRKPRRRVPDCATNWKRKGFRVLAVAAGPPAAMKLVGSSP